MSVTATAGEQAREEQSMADLLGYLERYGIRPATATLNPVKASLVDTLLGHARQVQANLIVLGGFAYKTNRAPFLSPLARDLLISSDIPLLLSH